MSERLLNSGLHFNLFWVLKDMGQPFVGQSNRQALVVMNSPHWMSIVSRIPKPSMSILMYLGATLQLPQIAKQHTSERLEYRLLQDRGIP